MALIKQANSGSAARDAIVLDLGDLRREAEALQARARAEADRIVAEAEAERERLLNGAHAEGYERGFAEGRAAGEQAGRESGHAEALRERTPQLEALEQSWREALGGFAALRDELLSDARANVLRLAAEVAERAVRRAIALESGGEAALRQLEHALSLVLEPTGLVVEVSPEDAALCREALPALMESVGGAASGAQIVEHAELSRGSVLLRGKGGAIDATVETRIERLIDATLGELPRLMEDVAPAAHDEASEADDRVGPRLRAASDESDADDAGDAGGGDVDDADGEGLESAA